MNHATKMLFATLFSVGVTFSVKKDLNGFWVIFMFFVGQFSVAMAILESQ